MILLFKLITPFKFTVDELPKVLIPLNEFELLLLISILEFNCSCIVREVFIKFNVPNCDCNIYILKSFNNILPFIFNIELTIVLLNV